MSSSSIHIVADVVCPDDMTEPGNTLAMMIEAPEPGDVLQRISGVEAEFAGEKRRISDWREYYRTELLGSRQKSPLFIFRRFVNSLLERATSGEAWQKRQNAFQSAFDSFDSVTDECVRKVLRDVGYRFPEPGRKVVMDAKRIVSQPEFTWLGYISNAEAEYKTDYQGDPFLRIKNVAYKTRDLAISELSDRYAAIDLHVVRVVSRTGMLAHGYGDFDVTTDVSSEKGYLFFHSLILDLSHRTGWPGTGYSPGEIDRMLWNFGRAICKNRPQCKACPLAALCLTHTCGCSKKLGDLELRQSR